MSSIGSSGDGHRFPPISREQMNDLQRRLFETFTDGWRNAYARNDGTMGGPMEARLYSPDISARRAHTGDYFRFETSLDQRLNELAILIIAREWNCQFQWQAHYERALDFGLSKTAVDQIAKSLPPNALKEDETVVYEVLRELLDRKSITDATFDRARHMLGAQPLIDLVLVAGHYITVAMEMALYGVVAPDPAGPLLPTL